jgi:hypothetical protein
MAALSKKLKVLVEDRRYAAQERSVKAQRDHRLAELFDHASAVYNAGVENADGKRSETFYANHSSYSMTTVFVKFMEEAESLIKVSSHLILLFLFLLLLLLILFLLNQ